MADQDVIRLTGISLGDKMRLLGAERVKIHSDNGWWRAACAGYTNQAGAAIYTGADAFDATAHCGPEKHVTYYIQPAADPSAALSPLAVAMSSVVSMSSVPFGDHGARIVVEMRDETNLYELLAAAWDAVKAAGEAVTS